MEFRDTIPLGNLKGLLLPGFQGCLTAHHPCQLRIQLSSLISNVAFWSLIEIQLACFSSGLCRDFREGSQPHSPRVTEEDSRNCKEGSLNFL